MRDAARRAVELSRGKEVADLDPDDETALALARLLEILGEAAARVTPELRERHPEIPWRDIADTRNRVIHEYFDVDLGIVEAIVGDDLPALIGQLEDVLKGMANSGEGDGG
jgi:uncharacterized protein with HEPN domain